MGKAFAAACTVMLGLGFPLHAQEQPAPVPHSTWQRWPGTTAEPKRPVTPAKDLVQDRRLGEILIELELLADPVTFPYLLEAHADASTGAIHLCGAVAGKAVHDHALLLARERWHPVVDAMTYQAAPVRPSRMPPLQLQKAALASLQASFPQPGHLFNVQCDASGRTKVTGFVNSFENKLTLSRQLRQVHGCSCVINLVHVTPAVADSKPADGKSARPGSAFTTWSRAGLALPGPADPMQSPPIKSAQGDGIPATVPAATQASLPVQQAAAWETTTRQPAGAGAAQRPRSPAPAASPGEPYVTHGMVLVPEEAMPSAALVGQLKECIARACGVKSKNIELVFTSARDLEILLTVSSAAPTDAFIQKLAQMPELAAYQVKTHIRRPRW